MDDFVRTEEEAPSIGPRSVKFLNTIKDGESRKAKPTSVTMLDTSLPLGHLTLSEVSCLNL